MGTTNTTGGNETLIRIRYHQHQLHRWQPDQDRVVVDAAAERKSLPAIANELGLSRDQAKRRVKALGVGIGKDLRPGILATLVDILNPCRPVTRAMLTKSAPGNRSALHRVINQMIANGELLGSPKDIRHPCVSADAKLFKQG